MRILKIHFVLLNLIFISSCCKDDFEEKDLYQNLIVVIHPDSINLTDLNVTTLGDKKTDIYNQYWYYGNLNDSVYLNVNLPLRLSTNTCSFAINFGDNRDTLTLKYDIIYEERALTACNSYKYIPKATNFELLKNTFQTSKIEFNEKSSDNTDFTIYSFY